MVRSNGTGGSSIGMDELISSSSSRQALASRRERRPPDQRPKQGFFRTLVQIFGEFLITAGVILLLFVVWELWWTNIDADIAQEKAVTAFVGELEGPVAPVGTKTDFGAPKPTPAVTSAGETFGVAYIPRLGKNYARPLVEGTAQDQLDTLGLGHYESNPMPGEIGNFAVAGHRQTHGAVLDGIHTLVPGDKIYVQTKVGYYIYVFRNNEIVLPNEADVLLPVPTEAGAQPTQHIMTMTSCNPRFGAEERIIAYSVLESWRPISAGPPPEVAAVVAKTMKKG